VPIAVVVVAVLVPLMRLVKTEFVRVALLHVPKTKHAAKAERHVARSAVMMDVVRIPIIAGKVVHALHANVPLDKPAVVLIVVIREKNAVVLEVVQHVAPEINTAMELDTVHRVTLCVFQTRNAAVLLAA
jgi:hypothetical protein